MDELTEDEIVSMLDLVVRLGLVRQRGDDEYELTPLGEAFANLPHDPEVLSVLPEHVRSRIVSPAY